MKVKRDLGKTFLYYAIWVFQPSKNGSVLAVVGCEKTGLHLLLDFVRGVGVSAV